MPARVVVIQPGGEDAAAAQLAAVLVRVDVVGVVGPRAEVLEVAERLAVGKAARGRAVLAVRQPRRARQDPIDVLAAHGPLAAATCPRSSRSER